MSPRAANSTSYQPKEGRRFAWAVKVSLQDSEGAEVKRRASEDGVTPSEWARMAIRRELRHTSTESEG